MRYDGETYLRLAFRVSFLLASVLAVVVETSCGDEGASRDLDSARDGGSPPMGLDPQAGDSQEGVPMSTMRIAHLAPGFGPIDFCYQGAKKGTFLGPVLGGAGLPQPDGGDADTGADADGSGSGDLIDASTPDAKGDGEAGAALHSASYRTVSSYRNLQAAGPMTIAIVTAGATSCGNPLATVDVTLDPGKLSTVALFERSVDGGLALDLSAFTDDRSTQDDKIRVRVIHAALGSATTPSAGPIAVRAVASKTTVLADRVEPKRASAASQVVMVDALGYVTAAPMSAPTSIAIGPAEGSEKSADAGFEPWQSAATDLDLRGGSLHTAFVLNGTSEGTFEVLWCADTTTDGDQTLCQVVGTSP